MALAAVLVSLAWMISAAYQPDYLRWFSLEAEIVILLGLLVTALVLVSVIALRHTRRADEKAQEPAAHASLPNG